MIRFLLVEDDPLGRALVEDMFRLDDVPGELVCVASAEEALARIPALEPVAILMDIRLPGMDGVAATAALKANPATHLIPVWAITALGERQDIDRALAAGCSAYFVKPVGRRQLAYQIRTFLEHLPPESESQDKETVLK